MRVRLTPDFISNNLICPPDRKKVEFVDKSDAVGLYVEVRATTQGQGTYYLRYKDPGGTTRHVRIGRTSEISLEDARKETKRLRAQITLGHNPKRK